MNAFRDSARHVLRCLFGLLSWLALEQAAWAQVLLAQSGSAKTICLNDLTIIALAKTLGLPVVSMERLVSEGPGTKKRRIPNICKAEGVEHLSFNDFLRREKLTF